ncbi:hypothetical protein K490DRAFT_62786 [Saccharata proteae CBS 121410]|uniref:C2H2-type domain-containing protein n=1 Tax=Saccharata proteae CBS 121410 TaxID=1314787 RepID=A0A9P4HY03_9PEZI|nr:hypothetical protein K490DRAFT_62786 [Saccharata proteae CBS 121410]
MVFRKLSNPLGQDQTRPTYELDPLNRAELAESVRRFEAPLNQASRGEYRPTLDMDAAIEHQGTLYLEIDSAISSESVQHTLNLDGRPTSHNDALSKNSSAISPVDSSARYVDSVPPFDPSMYPDDLVSPTQHATKVGVEDKTRTSSSLTRAPPSLGKCDEASAGIFTSNNTTPQHPHTEYSSDGNYYSQGSMQPPYSRAQGIHVDSSRPTRSHLKLDTDPAFVSNNSTWHQTYQTNRSQNNLTTPSSGKITGLSPWSWTSPCTRRSSYSSVHTNSSRPSQVFSATACRDSNIFPLIEGNPSHKSSSGSRRSSYQKSDDSSWDLISVPNSQQSPYYPSTNVSFNDTFSAVPPTPDRSLVFDTNPISSPNVIFNQNDLSGSNPFNDQTRFSDQNPLSDQNLFSNQSLLEQDSFSNQDDFFDQNPFFNVDGFANDTPFSNPNPFADQNPFSNVDGFSNETLFSNPNHFTDRNPRVHPPMTYPAIAYLATVQPVIDHPVTAHPELSSPTTYQAAPATRQGSHQPPMNHSVMPSAYPNPIVHPPTNHSVIPSAYSNPIFDLPTNHSTSHYSETDHPTIPNPDLYPPTNTHPAPEAEPAPHQPPEALETCPSCGYKFKGELRQAHRNLNRHREAHCTSQASPSQFRCKHNGCSKTYRRKDALRVHQKQKHTGGAPRSNNGAADQA